MAGGTSPRCWDVGVRIPPRALVQGSGTDPASDGGVKDNARRSPSRPPIAVDVAQFGRARRRHRRGRRFDPGHPLHALVAQLADAHGPDPWLSSMRVRIPPSARNDRENEPARVPGLAANECAPHGAGISSGHDPAGRRDLPDKQVLRGSTPRWPTMPPAPDRTGTGLLIRTAGVRVLWAARRTSKAPSSMG
jgi:hypothetical protein